MTIIINWALLNFCECAGHFPWAHHFVSVGFLFMPQILFFLSPAITMDRMQQSLSRLMLTICTWNLRYLCLLHWLILDAPKIIERKQLEIVDHRNLLCQFCIHASRHDYYEYAPLQKHNTKEQPFHSTFLFHLLIYRFFLIFMVRHLGIALDSYCHNDSQIFHRCSLNPYNQMNKPAMCQI